MTDGKHTPGPLEALALTLDETDLMPLPDGDQTRIEVAIRGAFGLDTTTGSREKDRLIAAAPELLEALERIEDILDGSDDVAAREALTEARAARAKAEGRET